MFGEKDILRKDFSTDDIKELQSNLELFEDRTVYYNRNNDLLNDARVQIETIEEATGLVEQLLIDGSLNEDIDEEGLEKLEELVNQIKDEAIKEVLLEQIGTVRLVLKEAEKELALDDVEDLEDLEEESEETLEEEDLDTVQDTDEDKVQTDTSTSQSNNQTNSNQSQTENNNRAPSTQTENESNNQPSNQNSNQSSTTEQRPAVANKYQETQVIEEIPFETIVIYENKNLPVGEEIVYVEGIQGSVTETYEVTIYKNGTSNRKLISRDKIEPVNQLITIGTKEPEVIEE